MQTKVLVSGFRHYHHTKCGGYDNIGNNPGVFYITDKTMPLAKFFPSLRYRRIALIFLDMYIRLAVFPRYDVLHYVYTEDQFYIPKFLKGKRKIIGTVHLNPVMVEESKSLKAKLSQNYLRFIQSFDLIIALSSESARIFRERYNAKTLFIPHGFSKPKFSRVAFCDNNNKAIDKGKINIFFSGTNYRDYDMFIFVINNINNDKLHFHVVGQQEVIKRQLKEYNNVSIYNRLSDDEYFSLLDTCDYNFLPLTFATANNVLLEAQSLGIKSILPEIDGISDYAAPVPLNLFYRDQKQIIDIFAVLEKTERNDILVEFAKKFRWENIFTELNKVYEEITGTGIR